MLLQSIHSPTRNSPYLSDTMVYYFTSNVVQPSAYIYMGKDKFESTTATPLVSNSADREDRRGSD